MRVQTLFFSFGYRGRGGSLNAPFALRSPVRGGRLPRCGLEDGGGDFRVVSRAGKEEAEARLLAAAAEAGSDLAAEALLGVFAGSDFNMEEKEATKLFAATVAVPLPDDDEINELPQLVLVGSLCFTLVWTETIYVKYFAPEPQEF